MGSATDRAIAEGDMRLPFNYFAKDLNTSVQIQSAVATPDL